MPEYMSDQVRQCTQTKAKVMRNRFVVVVVVVVVVVLRVTVIVSFFCSIVPFKGREPFMCGRLRELL